MQALLEPLALPTALDQLCKYFEGGVSSSHGLLQSSARLCPMLVYTPTLGHVLSGTEPAIRQRLVLEPVGVCRGCKTARATGSPGKDSFDTREAVSLLVGPSLPHASRL